MQFRICMVERAAFSKLKNKNRTKKPSVASLPPTTDGSNFSGVALATRDSEAQGLFVWCDFTGGYTFPGAATLAITNFEVAEPSLNLAGAWS